MSDQDRGAYTPQTDAPLAFDARQPRGGGGGGPPTALIISGLVLIIVLGAIYMFYRDGVRGANQPPQVVGTPVPAMKSPAPPSDTVEDQAAALDVYQSGDAAPVAAPSFAPAPEQPLPRPAPRPTLKVDKSDLPPVGPRLAVGPTPPTPMPPAPKAVPAPKPVAAPPKPVEIAGPPPAQPKAAPVPAPAAGGAAMVQIGAFSTPALANAGWTAVASAFPADMAGKGRKVEAVPGSALNRSLITGFATRDAAVAFCGKLKAAGRSCIVK